MTPAIPDRRALVLLAVLGALVGATLVAAPLPQDPAFLRFVDDRPWMGIPNAADVLSNLGFVIAGLVGLWGVTGARASRLFDRPADGLPYRLFFAGVAVLGLTSSVFHWDPDFETLALDRLAMTVPFMAFASAFFADRIDRTVGLRLVLPVSVVLGAASVGYWLHSETVGRGDLRPYVLVQFGPMLLLPLICWLYPKARYTDVRYLGAILVVYLVAKLLEVADELVYESTRQVVSGHTLKHLVAAVACWLVLPMIRARRTTG